MFAGMLYLKRGVIHNGNKILIRGTVKSFTLIRILDYDISTSNADFFLQFSHKNLYPINFFILIYLTYSVYIYIFIFIQDICLLEKDNEMFAGMLELNKVR